MIEPPASESGYGPRWNQLLAETGWHHFAATRGQVAAN